MASLMPAAKQQFFNAAGQPLSGGKLYTYAAGTLTPSVTYSDPAGTVPNTNPVILDARGEALIFWTGSYKVVLQDALGNTVYTVDNYATDAAAAATTAAANAQTTANNAVTTANNAVASATLLGASGASLVGFQNAGTGSVARTVQARLRDTVNVMDFGAKGDGVTDDTAAFNAALLAATSVLIPAGTYLTAGTINITLNKQKLIGAGIGSTTLAPNSTTLPTIQIANGLTNWEVANFSIIGTGTPVSGADGLIVNGTCSQSQIRDMVIQNRFRGCVVGGTDLSRIVRVICQKNKSDGFYFTTSGALGTMQWYPDSCLSQQNDGRGYVYITQAGPTTASVGTMINCYSYANSGTGISYAGLPTVPLNGVRILGGFYGEDGNHEIYLDTYGGQHSIRNAFTELAGNIATGSAGTTAATNTGSGIYITANNLDIDLTGVHANGHANNGVTTSATVTQITGGSFTNNGLALLANNRNGVIATAGRLMVTGALAGNLNGSTSQLFGVYGADGNNAIVMCCDLTGNGTSGYGSTTNQTMISSLNNLPNTLVSQIPAAGGLTLGNVTTQGAGTLNVAAGILKNGVAYTNP